MLPAPKDLDHLKQMLADATEARNLVCSRPIDALAGDRITCLAVERLLQRIGETAQAISPATRHATADIPWQRLAQLRQTLAVDPPDLDPRLLYAIGSRDAPDLIRALQTVLPSDED